MRSAFPPIEPGRTRRIQTDCWSSASEASDPYQGQDLPPLLSRGDFLSRALVIFSPNPAVSVLDNRPPSPRSKHHTGCAGSPRAEIAACPSAAGAPRPPMPLRRISPREPGPAKGSTPSGRNPPRHPTASRGQGRGHRIRHNGPRRGTSRGGGRERRKVGEMPSADQSMPGFGRDRIARFQETRSKPPFRRAEQGREYASMASATRRGISRRSSRRRLIPSQPRSGTPPTARPVPRVSRLRRPRSS